MQKPQDECVSMPAIAPTSSKDVGDQNCSGSRGLSLCRSGWPASALSPLLGVVAALRSTALPAATSSPQGGGQPARDGASTVAAHCPVAVALSLQPALAP